MFTGYFKMKGQPFKENTALDTLLCDERFEQALARLKYFLDCGQLALIVGQTGTGKTSLLKLFMKDLPPNLYKPIFIQLTNLNPNAFLRMIVNRLGDIPKLGKERNFDQIIARIKQNELEVLFIIDESHLMSLQSFIDLRLLISHCTDTNLRIKVLLCGQESLSDKLKRYELRDLVNRINVKYYLKTLSKSQTIAYIDHRLKSVGISERIFDTEAKNLIHDYSGGNPRQINNISVACLINAASKKIQKIGEIIVNEAMAEFRLG
jgi:general secretion pathway protein A